MLNFYAATAEVVKIGADFLRYGGRQGALYLPF